MTAPTVNEQRIERAARGLTPNGFRVLFSMPSKWRGRRPFGALEQIRRTGLATLAATLGLAGTAAANVVVTDLGATAPTGYETGHLVANTNAFGFRLANTHGQTFQVATQITLGKIYIGYQGGLTGAATATEVTLTVDAGNDGGAADLTESFILGTGGTAITQGGAAVVHWLELDVSSSSLLLAAGTTHSFLLTADSVTGAANTWYLAPSYTFSNDYTDGEVLGKLTEGPNRDANFAVSAGAAVDIDIASSLALTLDGTVQTIDVPVGNLGAAGTLTLGVPSLTGTNAAAFSVISSPATIPPGGSDFIQLSFNPTGITGAVTANLVVTSNDVNTPSSTVVMSGFIHDPQLAVASFFNFGSFPSGVGVQTGMFDIDNAGAY